MAYRCGSLAAHACHCTLLDFSICIKPIAIRCNMRTCGVVGYPVIIDQSLIIRLVITRLIAIKIMFFIITTFFHNKHYFFIRYICLFRRLFLFRPSLPFLSFLISLRLTFSLPATILFLTVPRHMSFTAAIKAFIPAAFIALAGPMSRFSL